MPWQSGTLTPQDVADAFRGAVDPTDTQLIASTDAARAWAQRRRRRTVRLGGTEGLWSEPDTHRGGVIYAAADYQSQVAPEGIASFDPSLGGPADTWTLRQRAAELVGLDVGIG